MTRQGQWKIERGNACRVYCLIIKQYTLHAFWLTPEFMSVKLLRSKNTLKQGKFLKFLKLTAKLKVMENSKRS